MPWVCRVFGNNFLQHPAFPQYFSIGEPLLTWQLLQDTGYSLCRGWFRKQSFVTWQILGLALHSDRPVGGVWTLFYTHTQLSENNSLWLCRFFSDRRGGWLLQRLGDGIGHSLTWLGNWTQQCVVRRQLSAITVGLFCALERFTPFNRLLVPSSANINPEKKYGWWFDI